MDCIIPSILAQAMHIVPSEKSVKTATWLKKKKKKKLSLSLFMYIYSEYFRGKCK